MLAHQLHRHRCWLALCNNELTELISVFTRRNIIPIADSTVARGPTAYRRISTIAFGNSRYWCGQSSCIILRTHFLWCRQNFLFYGREVLFIQLLIYICGDFGFLCPPEMIYYKINGRQSLISSPQNIGYIYIYIYKIKN